MGGRREERGVEKRKKRGDGEGGLAPRS